MLFLCSYLKAWDLPDNLKVNMEHGPNLHESKVFFTNFAGRCNSEMALCLREKAFRFVCMQLTTAVFLHVSDYILFLYTTIYCYIVSHKMKTSNKFMTFSATFFLYVNSVVL